MDHGFEVFLPLVQTKRASPPLFTGYFFCRIVDRWRSINSTLGVLCLVRTGDCPAQCPDREIEALKAMIDRHGYISFRKPRLRLPDARSRSAQRCKSRPGLLAGCRGFTPASRRASANSSCSIFSAVSARSRSRRTSSFRSKGRGCHGPGLKVGDGAARLGWLGSAGRAHPRSDRPQSPATSSSPQFTIKRA